MKLARCITPVLLMLLITLTFITPAAAQSGGNGRDPVFEQQVYDRLTAANPYSMAPFKAATEALDSGDYQTALDLYTQVLALVPESTDTLRRISYVEGYLNLPDLAIAHARKANDLDPTPENQAGLARALLLTENETDWQEAARLAGAAAEAQPNDLVNHLLLLQAGFAIEDVEMIRKADNSILQMAPDEPLGHYYAGILAALDEDPDLAEKELLKSQELGMPADAVQKLLTDTVYPMQAEQRSLNPTKLLTYGGIGVGAWLGGMALLFLAGWVLSQMTLRAVKSGGPSDGSIGASEAFVRRLYGLVISLTSAYFYLSIPVLVLVVIGLAAAIFYLFFAIGSIPIKIAIFLIIGVIYTLIAVVRSLFARVKAGDPGRPLSESDAPALWKLVCEVARTLGTRPVDVIFLVPGVEVSVYERGRLLKKLSGRGERVLMLGLGAMKSLNMSQLRAILAHEYGHFNNRDTAGGGLARQVQLSINAMGYGLAAHGLAAWYNPAWLFINGFHNIFMRVTLGASRLQEILADRYAAAAFGMNNLISGLKTIIRQDLAFNMQVNFEVGEARSLNRRLHNLYRLPPIEGDPILEDKYNEQMQRPSTAFDSHPAPRERLALIERVQSQSFHGQDLTLATDLLPNLAELEELMTAEVRDDLRQRRILPA